MLSTWWFIFADAQSHNNRGKRQHKRTVSRVVSSSCPCVLTAWDTQARGCEWCKPLSLSPSLSLSRTCVPHSRRVSSHTTSETMKMLLTSRLLWFACQTPMALPSLRWDYRLAGAVQASGGFQVVIPNALLEARLIQIAYQVPWHVNNHRKMCRYAGGPHTARARRGKCEGACREGFLDMPDGLFLASLHCRVQRNRWTSASSRRSVDQGFRSNCACSITSQGSAGIFICAECRRQTVQNHTHTPSQHTSSAASSPRSRFTLGRLA